MHVVKAIEMGLMKMNSYKQFCFFQIPELFICYIYVYMYFDNFEINIFKPNGKVSRNDRKKVGPVSVLGRAR